MATRVPQKKPVKTSKTPSRGQRANHTEPLSQYLGEISKIKVLTREEEVELAMDVADGNPKALQEMVRRNLKYVVTVANKYKGCGLSLQDLIEEGNIGLIQAAKRFDPSRKVKFITYAVWWIKQAIMHSLAEQSGTVKLPIKQMAIVSKFGKKQRDLAQSWEREPTQAEVADGLGIRKEDIDSIMRAYRTHLSLDSPLKNDEDTPYLDLLENPNTIPYDDQIMQQALKGKVDEMLKDLSPREEKILRLRFGFNGETRTLEEIGKEIGLSRERVRQIEKRAKARLRVRTKNDSLIDHLN